MIGLREITTNKFSTFRTTHQFVRFFQFSSTDEYRACLRVATEENRKVYILGNGSNTLFRSKTVQSMVLKNGMSRQFEFDARSPGMIRVGSSTPLSVLIKHCEKHSLDSFYYLASVPATVGGAVAMNAGRGPIHKQTVFDFIDKVVYLDGDRIVEGTAETLVLGHRQTVFTGVQTKLILHVDFKFPPQNISDTEANEFNKIEERIKWSKRVQDNSAPNCGSVFRVCSPLVMRPLKGFSLGSAKLSRKTGNWIISTGNDSRPIVRLIRIVRWLHLLVLFRAKIEIIEID